ncbi:MAG: HAMP domain-containing protein, partial [Candidatus Kryptonium sp.]
MWLIKKFNNLKWRYKTFIGIELIVIITAVASSAIYSIILGKEMERKFITRSETIINAFSRLSIYGILLQDANQLNQLIESFYDNYTSYIAVYSSDGKILAEKNLKVLSDERKKLRNFDGNVNYADIPAEGDFILDFQAKVYNGADLAGYVRFGFSKSKIDEAISKAHLIKFGFVVFVVFLGLVFGYIIVVLFVNPIEKVRHAAELVAQGDINVVITDKAVERGDEIGSLMRSFNKMVENIKNAIEEVTSQREIAEKLRIEADEAREKAQEHQRYLEDQFKKIFDVVESVSNGDLTKEAIAERDDEVGML